MEVYGYVPLNFPQIVDLFAGQLKSTLVCPECNGVSIKFDPYHMVQLPLPKADHRTISVYLTHRPRGEVLEGVSRILRQYKDLDSEEARAEIKRLSEMSAGEVYLWDLYKFEVPKAETVGTLRAALASETGIPAAR
jgi:hypothetical protein